MRTLLLLGCLPAAFDGALACSSPTSPPPPRPTVAPGPTASAAPTSTAPVDAGTTFPASCDLTASGVHFATAACETCMQGSCCAVTKKCFVDAPECGALYNCINACPSRGLGPADAGNGADATATDGGDPCVDACNAQHPTQVNAARDYIRCYAGSCPTQCQ